MSSVFHKLAAHVNPPYVRSSLKWLYHIQGVCVCWDRAALLLFPPALSPGRPSLRPAAFPSHSLCQETHRPGSKGLYTHLATAPRPPALLPHSLELFQGSAGKLLPESSFLVFVGLRLIQICFSSSAAPTMFFRNLSSLVPFPALPKLRVPPS